MKHNNERYKKLECLSLHMSDVELEEVKKLLKLLDFHLKDGTENTYSKSYQKGYEIKIIIDESNLKDSKIDYGNEIKRGRETTTNFSQRENLVVLECVDRLVSKGYDPNKIILEKDWKLGHKEKGSLDIQIFDEFLIL